MTTDKERQFRGLAICDHGKASCQQCLHCEIEMKDKRVLELKAQRDDLLAVAKWLRNWGKNGAHKGDYWESIDEVIAKIEAEKATKA